MPQDSVSRVRMVRRVIRCAGISMAVALVVLPAHATIQEQRERLPPPAECTEPITGRWKSHQYTPRFSDWTIFVLDVRRVEGSEPRLEGTISTHHWEGGPDQEEPGPCRPGQEEWLVSMDAAGTVNAEGRIAFWGVGKWRLDRVVCNHGPGGYNLDHFTGVIDADLQEFQSVNNDGGRAVNEPTLFRRVSCLPPPGQTNPRVVTNPPPFYPQFPQGGCL